MKKSRGGKYGGLRDELPGQGKGVSQEENQGRVVWIDALAAQG
jgi:hypothetical protein